MRQLGYVSALYLTLLPAHAADDKTFIDSDFSFEIGNRFWIGQMSYDSKLFEDETSLMISRLRWSDVNTLSNETTLRVTHEKSGLFLKGYGGFGTKYDGSLDDEDYIYDFPTPDGPFTGKYSDTYSKNDGDSSFYGAVDVGVAVPLPQQWPLRLSGFAGGFAQKQNLVAKGLRCNADEADQQLCGPSGTVVVPFDQKVIGYETTIYGARLGLEAVVDVADNLAWRNEAAYIFTGSFKLEDSHYLRTELGPTPNFVDEGYNLDGYQFETEISWALTESLSVTAGARYWRFNSGKADSTAGAQLPRDQQSNENYSRNQINQYGVTVGLAYKF